jgi:hypothetical protein
MIEGVPVRGLFVGVASKLDCLTVFIDSAVDIEDLARRGGPGRGVTLEIAAILLISGMIASSK